MCNVNYLIEIRRFNTFAARTRLPASAQLLWYKLIEIMNQHARGGDWCDGFLRIDNPYLLAYFPMSATALADARRTLCESGLLEYIPGEKKRTPPAYRLHYFSVCDGKGAIERDYPREIGADSTADCPADCSEIRDDPRDNPDSPADCYADCPEIRDYPRDHPNYPSVYPSDCTTVCPTDCTTDCTTDCHGNTPDFHDTNINYTETETENANPTRKTNDDETETSAFSAGYAGAGACTGAYACTDAGAREGAFPRSVRESAKLAGKVLLHQVFTENQLNQVMAAFGALPVRGRADDSGGRQDGGGESDERGELPDSAADGLGRRGCSDSDGDGGLPVRTEYGARECADAHAGGGAGAFGGVQGGAWGGVKKKFGIRNAE